MPKGRGDSTRHPVQRQYGPGYRDKSYYIIAKEASTTEVLTWLDKQVRKPTVTFPMTLRDPLSDITVDLREHKNLVEYRDGWKDGM